MAHENNWVDTHSRFGVLAPLSSSSGGIGDGVFPALVDEHVLFMLDFSVIVDIVVDGL